jgi:hypothetical protein
VYSGKVQFAIGNGQLSNIDLLITSDDRERVIFQGPRRAAAMAVGGVAR